MAEPGHVSPDGEVSLGDGLFFKRMVKGLDAGSVRVRVWGCASGEPKLRFEWFLKADEWEWLWGRLDGSGA